jgi:hypothetical protein
MRQSLISTATLVSLVACSTTDESTGPSVERAGNAQVTRPLKGRCETEVRIVSIAPDGRLQLLEEYSCRISHLGLTRNTVSQVVVPTGPPVNGVLPGAVTNTGAFVAANGDRLNSSFTGTAATDLATFTARFEGTETFSGGTGRFANAFGTAQVQGTAVLDPVTGTGTGQFTMEGTITY